MDMMESESSSSVDPSEQVYEENEVVWAKIHGYPWWPAFIGEVDTDRLQNPMYTVYFFGDYTHSRINSQKMRKFEPYFHTFAINARKNHKLKQSLISAQQQLQQNNQDVTYFDSVKPSKRGRKPLQKSLDQESVQGGSPDKNQKSPQLIVKRSRGRPRKVIVQNDPIQQSVKSFSQPNDHKSNSRIKPIDEIYYEQISKVLIRKKSRMKIESSQSEQDQIVEIKQLIKKRLYKQAVQYLYDIAINSSNIIQILESKVMEKLSNNVPNRQLVKLGQMLRKVLVEKYFPNQECALHDVESLNYDSIRGKTIRKLLKMLKRNIIHKTQKDDEKKNQWTRKMVFECQKTIKSRNPSSSEYMREVLSLLTQNENRSQILVQIQEKLKETLISQ